MNKFRKILGFSFFITSSILCALFFLVVGIDIEKGENSIGMYVYLLGDAVFWTLCAYLSIIIIPEGSKKGKLEKIK
jgi:hypothetical protein